FRTEQDAAGNETHVFDKFEQIAPGKLSPGEYDDVARDLTAFLSYVGEPIQMKRKSMGIWVLLFIAAFFGLAYMLKKE
ncbi:cytochrome C, partial [Candidatus Endoriftia persephone str. Guaymas]|nr:cytochrome C [Candidatus Endoriftia persephone str. Guaymas]